ncbi:MAG TPA: AAA family ATPase, partial [Gemmatimonadales bacterium]|nr:AAA family ATPase [Gemmatimonadales bacterium]
MTPPTSRLRIITLGRSAIETLGDGGGTALFGPGKPAALLAFLACAPGRSATREFLLDLLWSDSDPDRARNALRQLVWLVRSRLGEETLIADGDRLTLSPAASVDRDDLLAAVARGDTAGAVALYAGPFLPDLAAPGGAEFEHWADVERQHLHSAYVRAAELRSRELLDAGHPVEAVALARALRDRDPLREGSWRLLLEALLADRNLLGAATEADALSRALAEEHRTPERSTQRLLDQCRNGGSDTADGSAADRLVADLVGRAAEFGAAMRLWRSAQAGKFQHLHLTGEPGSGKSRLLDDVSARLRAGGARVVVVRARVGERSIPGAALADLVRALAEIPGATGVPAAVAEVLIGLEPALADRYPGVPGRFADPSDAWRLRAGATRELVASVVSERSIALVIDDVQWMDPESRGAI